MLNSLMLRRTGKHLGLDLSCQCFALYNICSFVINMSWTHVGSKQKYKHALGTTARDHE